MLGLKLNHVSKRGCCLSIIWNARCKQHINSRSLITLYLWSAIYRYIHGGRWLNLMCTCVNLVMLISWFSVSYTCIAHLFVIRSIFVLLQLECVLQNKICRHTDRIKFEWDQYLDRSFLFFAFQVKINGSGHAYSLGLLWKSKIDLAITYSWNTSYNHTS